MPNSISPPFDRFRAGYQADFDRTTSRRGSRSGEMIARCIVETGTSSYYSALRDSVEEPVLKEICCNIAADEIRHYKLFSRQLTRCLEHERIGLWRRLRVALGRIAESEDDELAYAYYAANETAPCPMTASAAAGPMPAAPSSSSAPPMSSAASR